MSARSITPWFAKAMAKAVLARLPISYDFWARARLFRHGRNDDPAYSMRVFQQHLAIARPTPGFVCLELGPGDAIASAVLTRAFGGGSSYQIDVGPFATTELEVYRRIARYAREQGHDIPALDDVTDFAGLTVACRAQYLTEGLESLRTVPTASVDFIFSHTCLQLVRASELRGTVQELRRIIRPGGAMSHRIAFNSHLDLDANSLRFSDAFWESAFVAKSGFYTNRLAPSEMVALFEHAGFACEIAARDLLPRLPDRRKLASRFRERSDFDLSTAALNLRLVPGHQRAAAEPS